MITDGYTFTIAVPKRLPLNAKALHTILGSRDSALINLDFYKKIGNKEQKLDHKKIQNNVFAQGLVAVDDATTGGVFLMKADKSAYLRIDTAYQNTSGEDFLTFTDTTKVATFNADKAAQKQVSTHSSSTMHRKVTACLSRWILRFIAQISAKARSMSIEPVAIARTLSCRIWKLTKLGR